MHERVFMVLTAKATAPLCLGALPAGRAAAACGGSSSGRRLAMRLHSGIHPQQSMKCLSCLHCNGAALPSHEFRGKYWLLLQVRCTCVACVVGSGMRAGAGNGAPCMNRKQTKVYSAAVFVLHTRDSYLDRYNAGHDAFDR